MLYVRHTCKNDYWKFSSLAIFLSLYRFLVLFFFLYRFLSRLLARSRAAKLSPNKISFHKSSGWKFIASIQQAKCQYSIVSLNRKQIYFVNKHTSNREKKTFSSLFVDFQQLFVGFFFALCVQSTNCLRIQHCINCIMAKIILDSFLAVCSIINKCHRELAKTLYAM